MNDFERTFARLLNQDLDATLGQRRQPPPFVVSPTPGRAGGRSIRPWLIPLAVAACVIAVAVGTVGATELLTDHRPAAPVTPPSSATSPAPSTTSTAPSPTSSPTSPARPSTTLSSSPGPTTTSSRKKAAGPTTVRLGKATLQLPAGWVARDYQQYEPPGASLLVAQPTCLTPASLPAGTGRYDCPLLFGTIAAGAAGNPVDVDTEGGFASDPEYCDNGAYRSSTVQSSDVDFGGRMSDHRRWELTCQRGKIFQIEQYVVATGPGYVLFSERADSAMSAAMADIVRHAVLPQQTSAVRYYDHGYVRSVTRVPGGTRITIDRVVPATGGSANQNPATYDYLIPAAVIAGREPPTVGSLITVFTDGSKVTDFYDN